MVIILKHYHSVQTNILLLLFPDMNYMSEEEEKVLLVVFAIMMLNSLA